jgi:hypothetical protein
MIDIDQFFVDVFGSFATHARMLVTFEVILVGAYWLVRIPRSKLTTVQDYQNSTKTLIIFVGLGALLSVFTVLSYFTGR